MEKPLHGEEGYVPEQERDVAEQAAETGTGLEASEEAEEAERALAEADATRETLPPTDEAPVPDDDSYDEPAGSEDET